MLWMILQYVTPDLDVSNNIAIIASSPSILNRTYGEFIDEFDDIVRFNRAPTESYETHVGSRTTIRVANQHVFSNVPHPRVGNWTNKGQPANFVKDLRNMKILMIGPQTNEHNGRGDEWRSRHENIHSSCDPYLGDYSSIQHICQVNTGHRRPSIGFAIIHLCIRVGVIPHIFGFGLNDEFAQHYWEDKGTHMTHHYKYERSKIKELIDKGLIISYE